MPRKNSSGGGCSPTKAGRTRQRRRGCRSNQIRSTSSTCSIMWFVIWRAFEAGQLLAQFSAAIVSDLAQRAASAAGLERQRLVAEHRLHHDLARLVAIERMQRDQVGTFGNDLVGILQDLELLEAVVPLEPHARADEFEQVDDA